MQGELGRRDRRVHGFQLWHHHRFHGFGDIDAETTGALLDRTFGALPAKAELTPVPAIAPHGLGKRIVIQRNDRVFARYGAGIGDGDGQGGARRVAVANRFIQ